MLTPERVFNFKITGFAQTALTCCLACGHPFTQMPNVSFHEALFHVVSLCATLSVTLVMQQKRLVMRGAAVAAAAHPHLTPTTETCLGSSYAAAVAQAPPVQPWQQVMVMRHMTTAAAVLAARGMCL
jgi:hypothetical protein